MIENRIRVISNWKPENRRESEAMRSLVMTEMEMHQQESASNFMRKPDVSVKRNIVRHKDT